MTDRLNTRRNDLLTYRPTKGQLIVVLEDNKLLTNAACRRSDRFINSQEGQNHSQQGQ
jgi:hypothetical protein